MSNSNFDHRELLELAARRYCGSKPSVAASSSRRCTSSSMRPPPTRSQFQGTKSSAAAKRPLIRLLTTSRPRPALRGVEVDQSDSVAQLWSKSGGRRPVVVLNLGSLFCCCLVISVLITNHVQWRCSTSLGRVLLAFIGAPPRGWLRVSGISGVSPASRRQTSQFSVRSRPSSSARS